MPTPWDALLTKLTAKLPHGKCAIFGQDGTPWTSLYSYDSQQMKTVFSGFSNPEALRKDGPTIDGVKYFVTHVDNQLIRLKKGPTGVMVKKTLQTYVVCSYDEANQSADAVMVSLVSFGEYLEKMNF